LVKDKKLKALVPELPFKGYVVIDLKEECIYPSLIVMLTQVMDFQKAVLLEEVPVFTSTKEVLTIGTIRPGKFMQNLYLISMLERLKI
jgi:hypothetical protein